jgi:hypothetical protein
MKRIFTASNIISALKNEGGSAVTGNALPVPSGSELPWAWPEVWVNDEDFEAASEIAADFQAKRVAPPEA